MKKFQGFVKNFVQVATLLVAGSMLAASPSQAATFASSNGELVFTNFSQSPCWNWK